LGYRLPGKFNSRSRQYRALWIGASKADDLGVFRREVIDSLTELRFVVENYEKYGEPVCTALNSPAPVPKSTVPPALELPNRVTLSWLAKHVSVGFWFKASGISISLILIGAALGRTTWFGELVKWVKDNWPP